MLERKWYDAHAGVFEITNKISSKFTFVDKRYRNIYFIVQFLANLTIKQAAKNPYHH